MLGALIGAGASLLGGLMGNAGKQKEIEYQKDFAQKGIRWRVKDAQAAGVHPALALGASTASYTPVGLGSDIAEGISSAGQDLTRAVDSTSTTAQKASLFEQASQTLTLQRMGLENDVLASQLARMSMTPPSPSPSDAFRIPGQPASGPVTMPSPFGLPPLPVASPEMAEQAQTHFGDISENIYGASNWLDSIMRYIAAASDYAKNSKKETHAEYLLRMKKNPMY